MHETFYVDAVEVKNRNFSLRGKERWKYKTLSVLKWFLSTIRHTFTPKDTFYRSIISDILEFIGTRTTKLSYLEFF